MGARWSRVKLCAVGMRNAILAGERPYGRVLLGSTVSGWLGWLGYFVFYLGKTVSGWFGWSTFSSGLKPGWNGWKRICVIMSRDCRSRKDYSQELRTAIQPSVLLINVNRINPNRLWLKRLIPIEHNLSNNDNNAKGTLYSTKIQKLSYYYVLVLVLDLWSFR